MHQYEISNRELATILGALRLYQHTNMTVAKNRPDWLQDIMQDAEMSLEEIDALCERLNCTGKDVPMRLSKAIRIILKIAAPELDEMGERHGSKDRAKYQQACDAVEVLERFAS